MASQTIHIWVPGLLEGAGGIQAFSRVYVQAIRQRFPSELIRVFIKNDELAEDDPLRQCGIIFYSMARYPKWLSTIMLVLLGGGFGILDRPACAIATHLHFLPALCCLKWLCGVPVASVLHGIEAWDLKGVVRIRALKSADHLIAVSGFTRQIVIEKFGIDGDKICVIPNTFDEGRFKPGPKPPHLLQRYGLREDDRILLSVSRLAFAERYKGHRQVLEALQTVCVRFSNVRYLIVGAGDDYSALWDEVIKRGLQEVVVMAGHVSGQELADHYRVCDVFVMPSSREGFGIVFLEAMACGKPVIAGKVDGSTDALDDGKLGLLVDPSQVDQIADAITQLLSSVPDGSFWYRPDDLHAAVVRKFGYTRVSMMLADDLAVLLQKGANSCQALAVARSATQMSAAPRVVVVTQLTSPYQVELFDAVAAKEVLNLEVIYLTSSDSSRQWAMPSIAHSHVILSKQPQMEKHAMQACYEADLVVFNYYMDWFALVVLHNRARCGRPWVFWGERPGFFQTGPLGRLARCILLKPLHRYDVPIWGVGHFGVKGYQYEFGPNRIYKNVPYFSNLKRFRKIVRGQGAVRVFLYAGALTHRKGVDLLAMAFVRLAVRFPHVRLILVGTGNLESHLRRMLSEHVGRVTWLGFQDWNDMEVCYELGTIFCFPSRYDGWGLALVEALAAGMPSIGTERTGAAVEFLGDGKAGWLIKAGKVDELETVMEHALHLPEERFVRMQQAAREAVVRNDLRHGVECFTEAAQDAISRWQT